MKRLRRMLALLLCLLMLSAALAEELPAPQADAVPTAAAEETAAAPDAETAAPSEEAPPETAAPEDEAPAETPAAEETPSPEAPERSDAPDGDLPSPEPSEGATDDPGTDSVEIPEMLLGATSLSLGAGETRALPVSFSDGQSHAFSCASSNGGYVKAKDGAVQGVRAGKSATITVTSEFGQSATLKVSVLRAPSSISVQPTQAELCPGERLTARAKLSDKSASAISWSSSDPAVATVDASGAITPVAAGSATIRCASFNGKSASVRITVHADPESIALDETELALGVGQRFTITSTAAPEDFGSRSYTSSDPAIVEVDASTGEMRALALGSAVITVQTYNGCTAQCAVTVKPAPSCITLSQTSMTLGVGEKLPLPQVQLGAPGEDCAGDYSVDALKSKYVTLTSDGCVTGARAGSATLTFRSYNGCTAKLKLVVRSAPRSVSLSPAKATLGVGETLKLTATLNSGAGGSVQFTSSDETVATVNESGEVTAVGKGSATITARSYNKRTASCSIQVLDAPTSIRLSTDALTLGAGESFTLAASLSAGSCRFESDNPAVATIDATSGRISAVAPGSAVLRAVAYNGVSAACALTVRSAPTGVAFRESALTLAVGDSYQLLPPQLLGDDPACASIKYSSSGRYLSVSASGLLSAKRAGKVTVSATTYNGKKASLSVTVVAAPKSIAFEQKSLYLCVGASHAPALKSTPAGISYRLSSSNPSVAAIADDGKTIQALRGGTATITATSYNNKTATLALTVPPLPDSLALEPAQLTLGCGDSLALKAVMPTGQDSSLTWTSSDPAVATVDGSGLLRAVAPGSTEITVRSYNGLESRCNLTVCKDPSRVELIPNRAVRSVDEGTLQLQLKFGAEEGGRCSFYSSDEAVATVNASGLVTLRGPGSATILAETYNGLRARCELTVGETPSEMRFPQENYAVALNDSVRLEIAFDRGCESYSLRTADERIAVAQGDEVTGLALGETALTAVSHSGLTATCALTVVPEPSGIELEQVEMSAVLGAGERVALRAQALPDGVGSIRYSSSDPSVATVDAVSGAITPVSIGSCVLTAETYNGHSAQCALTVLGQLTGVKIGIDPGHQAEADYSREAVSPTGSATKPKVSSGTAGRVTRVPEHVVNLQIGLKLRDALEALGAEVYMTRSTADVNISNQQRAKMMNALGVDLVLRIHCNGGSSSKNGMEIFVRQTGACKAESAAAAQLILNAMAKQTGAKNLDVKYTDTYTGLNWSTVPSMLMEVGYLTNAREDRLLTSSDYQDKLVAGMIEGVCAYMGRPAPAAISEE